MRTRLTPVKEHLNEALKDPYFKELYELDKVKTDIAKKIIEYRIKHGLTQSELAKRAGISQQQISHIEEGDFSSFSTIQKVLLSIGSKIKSVVIGHLSPGEIKAIKTHAPSI